MLFDLKKDLIKTAPKKALLGIPVNTVAVTGKGMALYMKLRWPEANKYYVSQCRKGRISNGDLTVYDVGDFLIAFLPTKIHWSNPSTTAIVDHTLHRLYEYMIKNEITDVHLPQLGCGVTTGQLNYRSDVHPLMAKYFGQEEMNVNAFVYDWG